MKLEEARYALDAQRAGALEMSAPVKSAMKAATKVMTSVAHYL